jgi:AraC family transcriptional regulator
MEWLTSIRTAIDYMEEHLTDNISVQDVADQVYLSPFFLQKDFSLMTDTVSESISGTAGCTWQLLT